MFQRIINKTPDKALKTIAAIMVCLMVGPEVIAGAELMALVNVLGADVFIVLVFSSFYTQSIKPLINKFLAFEKDSFFHLVTWQQVTRDPLYLMYLIPVRTFVLFWFLSIVSICVTVTMTSIIPLLTSVI